MNTNHSGERTLPNFLPWIAVAFWSVSTARADDAAAAVAGLGCIGLGLVAGGIWFFRVRRDVIGRLNMLSNRNIDSSASYELLKSYAGGTNADMRRTRAASIEDATDLMVRSVPGGEFVRNVKVLKVTNWRGTFFAVEGDVWGTTSGRQHLGFRVGDIVRYSTRGKTRLATILDLADDVACTVRVQDSEEVARVPYADLVRVQSAS